MVAGTVSELEEPDACGRFDLLAGGWTSDDDDDQSRENDSAGGGSCRSGGGWSSFRNTVHSRLQGLGSMLVPKKVPERSCQLACRRNTVLGSGQDASSAYL